MSMQYHCCLLTLYLLALRWPGPSACPQQVPVFWIDRKELSDEANRNRRALPPFPISGYFAMVCILIAGSLWGCLGLFNRHLSALGIAPETVVMLRNLGACLILGLIFLVYDRSIFRIRLRHLPIFLCSGLISILFFTLCYFRSQQVSSLAVAAILLYTAPTFVVILVRPSLEGPDHQAETGRAGAGLPGLLLCGRHPQRCPDPDP